MDHDDFDKVISFRTKETRVNVYYATRSIGTAMYHPLKGKSQIFRNQCTAEILVAILKDPLAHSGKLSTTSPYKDVLQMSSSVVETPHGPGILVNVEEELRNDLIKINESINDLMAKQLNILKSLKICDDLEAEIAADRIKSRTSRRLEEEEALKKLIKIKNEEKKRRQQAESRDKKRELEAKRERDRSRVGMPCQECEAKFFNDFALMQHCREEHGLSCLYCGRVFRTFELLEEHCIEMEHF